MTKIIGHRGYSGKFPENTLTSIQAALQLGVDCVEIDVRLTKDNVPVLLHDPCIHDLSLDKAQPYIHELSFAETQKYDVGVKFDDQFMSERIIALKDILQLDWKNTSLMIEIKESVQADALIVDRVFNVLRTHQEKKEGYKLPNFIIGSFSTNIVGIIQELIRNVNESNWKGTITPIGIIDEERYLSSFIQMGIKHLALWWPLITPSLMTELKKQQIEVWAFTVDDPSKAKELANMDVNGIITNFPS